MTPPALILVIKLQFDWPKDPVTYISCCLPATADSHTYEATSVLCYMNKLEIS
jgi:hypothetical protein